MDKGIPFSGGILGWCSGWRLGWRCRGTILALMVECFGEGKGSDALQDDAGGEKNVVDQIIVVRNQCIAYSIACRPCTQCQVVDNPHGIGDILCSDLLIEYFHTIILECND